MEHNHRLQVVEVPKFVLEKRRMEIVKPRAIVG